MTDMAYQMEYRGLIALEELIGAAKGVHLFEAGPNADPRQLRLGEAIRQAERIFGLDVQPHRPKPVFFDRRQFNGETDAVEIGPDGQGELLSG